MQARLVQVRKASGGMRAGTARTTASRASPYNCSTMSRLSWALPATLRESSADSGPARPRMELG
eukprot:8908310-Alexandrium_andersonii.AAC.1